MKNTGVYMGDVAAHIEDPTNLANWNLLVIAWSSLRREGKTRIKPNELLTRVDVLKWCLQHLGLPSVPWVVKQVADDEPIPADAGQLCTVVDTDGRCSLASFVNATELGLLARDRAPRPNTGLASFLGAGWLQTHSDEHNQDLMANLDAACLDLADESKGQIIVSLGPISAARQRIEKLFNHTKNSILIEFTKMTWPIAIKESWFTYCTTQFMKWKMDSAVVGTSDDELKYLSSLLDGTVCCKNFIRNYRYLKPVKHMTLDRFLEIEPDLTKSIVFLEETVHVKPHVSMHILQIKTEFLKQFRNTLSFTGALKHVRDELGCDEILHHWPYDELLDGETRMTLEVWFRQIFYLCTANVFTRWGENLVKPESFDMLSASLAEASRECVSCGYSINDLMTDLLHFCTALKCSGKWPISARSAKQSKLHLENETRCTIWQHLLTETTVGKVIVSGMDTLCEISASDDIGDRRAVMTLDFLRSDKLPSLVEFGKDLVLQCPKYVWQHHVWRALDDTLGNVLECKRVWSKARADEAAEEEGDGIVVALGQVVHACQWAWFAWFKEKHESAISDLSGLFAGDMTKEMFTTLVVPVLRKFVSVNRQQLFNPQHQHSFISAYMGQAEKGAARPWGCVVI